MSASMAGGFLAPRVDSIPADKPAAYLQISRSRGSIRREIATKVTPTSSACERDDDVGGTAGHWSRPYAIAGGHLRSTNIGTGLDEGDAKKIVIDAFPDWSRCGATGGDTAATWVSRIWR
jgi:hypothetical protein